MALKKCPICELNYIKGDAPYCDVCTREMKRAISRKRQEEPAEQLLCFECGEAPAVRGSELCAACLKEHKRQVELENAAQVDLDFVAVAADDEDEEDIDEELEEDD